MGDFWAFLLQTLTASGAAALLLVVKAMFRDKLSPRWQFAIWGVLGLVLTIPAGIGGRYALFNWPFMIEALKTWLTGSYTLTEVMLPIPLPAFRTPETALDWAFLVYILGVAAMLLRYLVTYLRLRLALRSGTSVDDRGSRQIREVAERYGLPVCRAVEVTGLSSAFICGVLRPILVLPASEETDEKVILHELLHLKYRDAVWGLVICLFRCIHWCNPLLWYCANRAGNDLEALCDQRVLERLAGEDRRDYGRILLAMSNDRYACVPGTSSMANGGRNIRRRIEAIARFRKYPAGMKLVSVCVAVMLSAPLVLGTQATGVYTPAGTLPAEMDMDVALASARTVRCTTPAGALDAYSKALMTQNGIYRAMCAPVAEHAALAAQMGNAGERGPVWDTGLPCRMDEKQGYAIYNLEPAGKDAYEGLVVTALRDYPDRRDDGKNWNYIAAQAVNVEKEKGRWVVLPQEDFRVIEVLGEPWLTWGIRSLPSYVFADTADGFRAEVRLQKIFTVDNTVEAANDLSWAFGTSVRYDTVPKPDAVFDQVCWTESARCVYVGDEAEKTAITSVGLSVAPLKKDGSRPELREVVQNQSGSGSDGSAWGTRELEGNWASAIGISGGGTTVDFDRNSFQLPKGYAGQLYINRQPAAELTLRLQEGGAP